MAKIYQRPYNIATLPVNPSGFDWQFFDDFNDAYTVTSNAVATGSSPYNGVSTTSGTISFLPASTDTSFGVMTMAGTTADKTGNQIQQDTSPIGLYPGAVIEAACRFQFISAASAASNQIVFGLFNNYGATGAILNATETADATAVNLDTAHYTNGVGILKTYSAANPVLVGLTASSTAPAYFSATPSMGSIPAVGTWSVIGFQIAMDPTTAQKGTVTWFQDGNVIQTATSTNLPKVATAGTNQALLFGYLQAGTTSLAIGVDYVWAGMALASSR